MRRYVTGLALGVVLLSSPLRAADDKVPKNPPRNQTPAEKEAAIFRKGMLSPEGPIAKHELDVEEVEDLKRKLVAEGKSPEILDAVLPSDVVKVWLNQMDIREYSKAQEAFFRELDRRYLTIREAERTGVNPPAEIINGSATDDANQRAVYAARSTTDPVGTALNLNEGPLPPKALAYTGLGIVPGKGFRLNAEGVARWMARDARKPIQWNAILFYAEEAANFDPNDMPQALRDCFHNFEEVKKNWYVKPDPKKPRKPKR